MKIIHKDRQNKRGRILIVEDNAVYAKYLSIMLRENGYEVLIATDRNHGVLGCAMFRPDIALIDFTVLGCDGLTVAEKLREVNAGLPIMMMTGCQNKSMERKAREMGINYFFEKPFELEDLIVATKECISVPVKHINVTAPVDVATRLVDSMPRFS
jgi:DNA-binding response OmpR family regulator